MLLVSSFGKEKQAIIISQKKDKDIEKKDRKGLFLLHLTSNNAVLTHHCLDFN